MKKFVQGEKDMDSEIGKLIIRYRKKKGWSRVYFASVLEISCQQLDKYEHGRGSISVARLLQIIDQLNIPVDYFYKKLVKARTTLQ